MDFLALPVAQAEGAILAHALNDGTRIIRKGTVLTPEHVRNLAASGHDEVIVARLGPDDVGEDEAAEALAHALAGRGVMLKAPFTGRVNLHAAHAGVLVLNDADIQAFNSIDEGVTVATLAPFSSIAAGEMIATVKIIPFAVPRSILAAAAAQAQAAIGVAAFRPHRIVVISTMLPQLKSSVVGKTLRTLESRLAASGSVIADDIRVPHATAAVADALASAIGVTDMALIFGASAVTDRRDVIPAAIAAAGGHVDHVGMPVDPGNLLVLGHLAGKPVIGAPGCARSPRENGFDWVLNRLLAGLPVTPQAIMRMGVGGLLKEIATRPQPRGGEHAP